MKSYPIAANSIVHEWKICITTWHSICSGWDGNLLLHILDFDFWALKWLKGKYMLMSVSSRHLGYWRYEILAQTNPIYVVICQKVQFFCKPLYKPCPSLRTHILSILEIAYPTRDTTWGHHQSFGLLLHPWWTQPRKIFHIITVRSHWSWRYSN